MAQQLALEMPTSPTPIPDLPAADVFLVNSSGGKDSQAMLDYVVQLADTAGVRDRITVLHCDLGDVEWPGTHELAQRQAAHYGLRFEVRRREQGLLLEQVSQRKASLLARADRIEQGDDQNPPNPQEAERIRNMRPWPSSMSRWCTSDQKRAPARKLITQLVAELNLDRPATVINCLGLRAAESHARAQRPILAVDPAATSGTRTTWTWHPIHTWTDQDVWQRIADSGVPYHPAYDSGMNRLSCSFCVLADRNSLVTAARLRPDLAAEYVAREELVGHPFRLGLSMTEVIAEAERLGPLPLASDGAALRRHALAPAD